MAIDSTNQLLYTYNAIKYLTGDFKSTDAYKKGIIDKDGNRLISHWAQLNSSDYKEYNIFIRLLIIIKKLLKYVPKQKKAQWTYPLILKSLREACKYTNDMDFLFEMRGTIEKEFEDSHLKSEILSQIMESALLINETHSHRVSITKLMNMLSELEESMVSAASVNAASPGAGTGWSSNTPNETGRAGYDKPIGKTLTRKKKKSALKKADDYEDKVDYVKEKPKKKSKKKSHKKLIDKL